MRVTRARAARTRVRGVRLSSGAVASDVRRERADGTARRCARFPRGLWARAGTGDGGWRRRSPGGAAERTARFPLGMADWDGRCYLVPMTGADCNWVCNVRAGDGRITLRRGKRKACMLAGIPAWERAPIPAPLPPEVPGAGTHVPAGPKALRSTRSAGL